MPPKAGPARQVPFRTGARRVSLANEGHYVFLYDEAALPALRAAQFCEDLLGGKVEHADARCREIEAAHRIVIYELCQDDDVIIDLAVGAALGARERKAAVWHEAQKTILHLPSGKLRVETMNSSRLGADAPGEEGRTLDVPSGDYLLTLNRVNWDALGSTLEARPDLPTEFITLTPLAAAKAPKQAPAVLAWDEIAGNHGAWEREWRIAGGVFHGRVFPGAALLDRKAAFVVNLTPTAVARLGWRWGARLRCETERWRTEAVFLARTTLAAAEHVFGRESCAAWAAGAPFHTQPALARTPGSLLLGFVGGASPAVDPNGEDVRIVALPDPVVAPLDLSLLEDRHADEKTHEIHCRVVSCSERCLVLNVDEATLKDAGYDFARNDQLQLVIAGDERPARRGGTSNGVDDYAEAWYAQLPAAQELLARVAASDAAEFGEHLELARSGRYCGSLKLNRAEPARTLYQQIWDLEIPPALRPALPLCWRLAPHLERAVELVTFTAIADEVSPTRDLRNPIHVAAQAGDVLRS